MRHTLRIDYDDATKAVTVTAGASAPFGDSAARVSFVLNFDPAHTHGGLTQLSALLGTVCAIPDTINAIPDNAIPC
jgi:hypothetical protein